jgi:hypothetical protein
MDEVCLGRDQSVGQVLIKDNKPLEGDETDNELRRQAEQRHCGAHVEGVAGGRSRA